MKKICNRLLALVLTFGLVACGAAGGDWQSQYNLGLRYLSEGNYQDAIIAFTAAIEIDPQQAEIYLKLGDAYLAMDTGADTLRLAQEAYKQAHRLGFDVSEYLDRLIAYAVQNHPVLSYESMPSIFFDPIDSSLNSYAGIESVVFDPFDHSSLNSYAGIESIHETRGYVSEDKDNGELFVSENGFNIYWPEDTYTFSHATFYDSFDYNGGEIAFDDIFINSTYEDLLSVFDLDSELFADYDLMLISHLDASRSKGWVEAARESSRWLRLEYKSEDTESIYVMMLLFEDNRLFQATFNIWPETSSWDIP